MIIEIELSKYKIARVWIDELPSAEFKADNYLVSDLPGRNGFDSRRPGAGVELYVGLGPRMLWGLLGATLEKCDTGQTEICMGYSASVDEEYRYPVVNFLAGMDRRPIGLIRGYANAVSKGLAEGIKLLGKFPAGQINITRAAYGEISSSEHHFYKISKLLPALLLLPDHELFEENIRDLFIKLGI